MLTRFTGALAVPAITLTLTAFEQPPVSTIRAIVATPDQYANRPVTVTGRYRGRTSSVIATAGPPLNRSRWDFVLKSADDAVIWISGLRPAGWDFDLDPKSAVPASGAERWLDVTGTVRVSRPRRHCPGCTQIWIEASDLRPASAAFQPLAALRPPVSAPVVVFNDPVTDERDVPRSTRVRLQFSRQMMAETFSEHVRVSYASPRQLSALPIARYAAEYRSQTRSLELRFASPLDRYETVKVELLEGITALNGCTLAPWAFTFTTGE